MFETITKNSSYFPLAPQRGMGQFPLAQAEVVMVIVAQW